MYLVASYNKICDLQITYKHIKLISLLKIDEKKKIPLLPELMERQEDNWPGRFTATLNELQEFLARAGCVLHVTTKPEVHITREKLCLQ